MAVHSFEVDFRKEIYYYSTEESMINLWKKGGLVMKKNDFRKPIAKGIASALNAMLRVDANSTSCIIAYQPKAPEKLSKFKGIK